MLPYYFKYNLITTEFHFTLIIFKQFEGPMFCIDKKWIRYSNDFGVLGGSVSTFALTHPSPFLTPAVLTDTSNINNNISNSSNSSNNNSNNKNGATYRTVNFNRRRCDLRENVVKRFRAMRSKHTKNKSNTNNKSKLCQTQLGLTLSWTRKMKLSILCKMTNETSIFKINKACVKIRPIIGGGNT